MKTFLLVPIITLGFFLRSQETLSGNFLFLKDQGRDMLAVKSIVVDKKPTLIGPYTGLQAVFQGPLYYYVLAVPFALSGGDPRLVMWLMLFANMASIPLLYLIGRKFFSESVGLWSAFLMALSPSAAAAATFIWSPFLVIPIAAGAIFFLLKKSLTPLAICLGLLFHFEIAFALPFTIVVILLLKKIPHVRFFAIIALFLLPLILFDFRHDHITARSLIQLFWGSAQGLSGASEPYTKIVRDHFTQFFLRFKGVYIDRDPVSSILSFIAIVSGLGYFLWGKNLNIKLLLVLPLFLFLVYMAYPFQIYDWYLVGLFPVYIILGATTLAWLQKGVFGRIILGIIVLILLHQSTQKLFQLYRTPDYGGTSKIQGKIDAIDAMYKDANGAPFALRVFTPVVLTDAYDYLLWWHGEKTYGYLPGNRGILYLLIEPDPGKLWSYNGWLETEIKVGKIIETQELPSGFIIQKRQV